MKRLIHKRIIFCSILIMCAVNAFSQTVIVTDDAAYTSGNASSVLDIKSTSKGILVPRMTQSQRTSISSPATGLMVYQTDGTVGFYYYDGSAWKTFANTDITSVNLNQTGLNVKGATSNALTIRPNETLSAARTLDLVTGDANRTLTFGGDITTAGAFSTSGANSLTLTTTGATNVTLPTSGTLVNSAVTTLSSLASVGTITTGTWNGTTIATTRGGTGLTSYTLGDVPYASAANTLTNLAGNTTTTKMFLNQTGNGSVSAAPTWSALTKSDVGLGSVENTALSTWAGTSNITTLGTIGTGTWNGTTIATTRGGTGLTSYTLGDVPYASASNTLTNLAGNTTTTKMFLNQTGNGTVSAAPTWSALTKSDVGLGSVENTALSTWAGTSNITTLGTIGSGTWNATAIGVNKGGSGLTTIALGDLRYGSAANTMSNLAGNTTTTKMFLTQTGTGSVSAAPAWNALSSTDIDASVSSTEFGYLSNVTSDIQSQLNAKAASGTNTDITSVSLNQTGLNVRGATTNALTIRPNETLSAARTLNLVTGDANRTLTFGGDITTAGAFSTSGANSLTLTTTGATNVTLPTSGTLVNSAVTTLSSLASVGTITTGTWNGTTIATTRGGTGLTSYTLGDVPYASAANTLTNLAGNTTTTKMFLNQTGNGTVSAAPTWSALSSSDVGLGNVENTALSTWAGSANITTIGTVTSGSVPGALIAVRQITASGTYTPTTGTKTIVVHLIGGGGGGGGVTGAASSVGVGGGGGAGGYLYVEVTGVTGTYTVTVGAAGTAGANTGGTGGAGGSTTFVNGGTTYTANGGAGGVGQVAGTAVAAIAGGAGAAVSTNGDVNSGGAPGTNGYRGSGTVGYSGAGGSGRFGGGGVGRTAAGAGNAATGFGAGGGGGMSTSTAATGGAGTAGIIVIYEYR